MNWEIHKTGYIVRMWPFFWKRCKAFIDGLLASTLIRKLRSRRVPPATATEHGSGGVVPPGVPSVNWESVPLIRQVVFSVSLSPSCPWQDCNGSSRRVPEWALQTVSAFQFMPVSGLTEARVPFFSILISGFFPDISLYSTKLHNIIFERSAIPLYSIFHCFISLNKVKFKHNMWI